MMASFVLRLSSSWWLSRVRHDGVIVGYHGFCYYQGEPRNLGSYVERHDGDVALVKMSDFKIGKYREH